MTTRDRIKAFMIEDRQNRPYVRGHMAKNICWALGLSLTSEGGIRKHLEALVAEGFLERTNPTHARGVPTFYSIKKTDHG